MAAAGEETISLVASKKVEELSIPRHLYLLFDIQGITDCVRGQRMKKEVKSQLRTLGAYLEKLSQEGSYSGSQLYCGDSFLQRTEHTWREVEDKEKNTKEWKETQDLIGIDKPGKKSVYWNLDQKKYVPLEDDDVPERRCDGLQGFAMSGSKTLVICPTAFDLPRQNLDDVLENNQASAGPDKNLDDFDSLPGVMLHEFAHLLDSTVLDLPAINADGSPAKGSTYKYAACANLAEHKSFDGASHNADNFHLYCLASYLNRWDWETGKSRTPEPLKL